MKSDEARRHWKAWWAEGGIREGQPLADRRSRSRLACPDEPVLVETKLGAGVCLLANISGSGAMLRGDPPNAPGETLSITLSNGSRLMGIVCWVREHAFGLRFEKPADLPAVLSPTNKSAPDQTPREPRVPIGRKVTVEVDGRRRSATLLDISQRGAKLEVEDGLDAGEVLLRLPDMQALGATIRWRDEGTVGVAFDETIAFSDFACWIQRHQQRLSRTTLGTIAMVTAASAVAGEAAPNSARTSLSVGATVVESCLASGGAGSGRASVTCSGTARWSVSETVETKALAQETAQAQSRRQDAAEAQKTKWITISY